MSAYALLALDMDGTLLDDNQQIGTETITAIHEAQQAGINVILSTGRAFVHVQPYVQALGLQSPMVLVNGGEVWKNPREIYKRHLLKRQVIQQMYALSKQYDVWFWAYSTQGWYNKDNWTADIETEDWLKFGYLTKDEYKRERLWHELRAIGGLELTNSSPDNIEINPAGVNKATGVQAVCEFIGCDMSQVVAVGDSLNDLAIIQAAGLGVAMGNAQEQVKQVADITVRTNNEQGVAQVIREYLL